MQRTIHHQLPPRPSWSAATRWILLGLLSAVTAGCPYAPPETRHPHIDVTEPIGKARYWRFVPSYYSEDRDWPLVVTLHGTNPWDGRTRQILEWKDTAERHGLIVVAPQLTSTQGPMPVIPTIYYAREKDLQRDERTILEVIDHVVRNYRVDEEAILLTGFSSGGFPLFYAGLRNPERFDMLIARDCNSTVEMFKNQQLSDEAKKLPIAIFWGKDDLSAIQSQSWAMFRYLRENGCRSAVQKVIDGGHLRRPDVARRLWAERLPPKHLR